MKTNLSVVTKVLMNDTNVAFQLAKVFLQSIYGKTIDYRFRKGKASFLPLLTIRITPSCNLRCLMCGQRGVKGTLKGATALAEAKKIIKPEVYKKFIDDVAGKTKVFYVWGGEPFLYPGFMDLAEYMAKKIPAFTVNTNGTFLAKNAERIVRDKWGGIFISLDGFEDTNDKIRGKGSYQKVMEGIEAINREKERQNSHYPYMGIVSTISNMNYMYLDKLAAAMKDKGLSWHIINLGTYVTPAIGKEHQAYLKKHLGVNATYWKGFATGYNEGIDGTEFAKILEKVHSYDNGYPIITVPVIRPSKIGMFYGDLFKLVRDKCSAPWFSVDIDYNGDVNFCADYKDFIVGNIAKDSIWDIYNNEKSVKFRNALKNAPDGMFPGCKRCYQMNLWGHRRRGI